MNQAVVVFTRIPEAGRTKTRLMPYLKPEECAGLHMAFLQDLSEALTDTIADVFVAYTGGGPNEGAFRELLPGGAVLRTGRRRSGGADVQCALSRAMSVGYERCILIGTDVPYADKVDFNRAFTILREKDYVLGPTEDGGYWLIGARAGEERMMKPLFSLGEYSHSEVLQDTLEMIPSWKGYGLLEEKWDIDTIEDLLLFRESAKGHSGEYLKKHHVISVIVPVYNEVALVQPFVKNLERLEGRCEIIFVDGGSSDGTRAVLREAEAESGGKIRFLESSKGRGMQMNIGAEAANGDILFFLHIDAELPEHPVEEILSVMEKVDARLLRNPFPQPELLHVDQPGDFQPAGGERHHFRRSGTLYQARSVLRSGHVPGDSDYGRLSVRPDAAGDGRCHGHDGEYPAGVRSALPGKHHPKIDGDEAYGEPAETLPGGRRPGETV